MRNIVPHALVLSATFAAAMHAHAAVDGLLTSANNARNLALQQSYFSLDDDFNIWVNPAFVNKYKGRAYIEHTEMAGGNIATGVGVWGLYLGRNYSGSVTSMGVAAVTPGTTNQGLEPINMDNKFDLFYGRELAAAAVGVRLNYNSYSSSTTAPVTGATLADEASLSARDINLSAGFALKNLPVDGALVIGLPSLDSEATLRTTTTLDRETLSDDGARTIALFGRAELMRTPQSSFIGSLSVIADNTGALHEVLTAAGTTTQDTASTKTTSVGAVGAYHWRPVANNLVLFTAGLGWNRATLGNKIQVLGNPAASEDEIQTTVFLLPVSAAYELTNFGATGRWALRASVSKNLFASETIKNKDNLTGLSSETESSGPNPVSFGIGAGYSPIKDLSIDANMSQATLFRGTNLLSTNAGTLFTRVTITWRM